MKKVYVDGVGVTIVAERVEYLDENGKLVTESLRDFTKKALRKRFASLDDFLKRWKAAERKQAIVEELAAEGLPLEPHRRGGRQGPRSVRPDLPRRLRPAAAHPPRAGRERQEARRLHEVRPAGPRRARCAARQVRGRGRAQPRRRQRAAASRRSTRWARRCSSSRRSAARTASSRPSTNCKPPSIRKPRNPCPSAPPSNPSRTSCARTPASMATRSASASSAGCSSSRSSTIRTRNWNC